MEVLKMQTDQIIVWLRIHAKCADYTWRRVMLEAADRLEQLSQVKVGTWITKNGITFCSECLTCGSEAWKSCPVCEAKMLSLEEGEK